jgi:hypothetical protein
LFIPRCFSSPAKAGATETGADRGRAEPGTTEAAADRRAAEAAAGESAAKATAPDRSAAKAATPDRSAAKTTPASGHPQATAAPAAALGRSFIERQRSKQQR